MDEQILRLPLGATRVRRVGPTQAPTVVLAPGFSAPLEVWGPTLPALAERGWHGLAFDWLGRGGSAALPSPGDLPLLRTQLLQLLDACACARPVVLVGLSMGGPVVAAAALERPYQVRGVVLVDPVVLPLTLSWRWRALALPWLGRWLMAWFGPRWLMDGLRADFHRPQGLPPDLAAAYRQQLRRPTVRRALHCTLRAGLLGRDYRPLYARLAATGLPVRLLWGEHDATVPLAHARALQAVLPAPLTLVPAAGHLPHLEGGLPALLDAIAEVLNHADRRSPAA